MGDKVIKRLKPGLLERALAEHEANIALNLTQIDQAEIYLADAPLSFLKAEGILDLSGEINPYFRKAVAEFTELVAAPVLGSETTTLDKYSLLQLNDFFKVYKEWIDRKPDIQVDSLTPESVQNYLNDQKYRQTLERLIEESHQTLAECYIVRLFV